MSRIDRRLETIRLATGVLTSIGGSSSSAVIGCLERGDHTALINCSVFPSLYDDRDEFYRDYCSINLLSKYDNLDIDVDRAAIAMDKFFLSEEICRQTNLRLSRYSGELFGFSSPVRQVIESAIRKIYRLLGDFSLDECLHQMHFSSGASTDVPKRKGDSWYKYGLFGPSTTGANAELACCAIAQYPQWETIAFDFSKSTCGLNIVRGNRLTTVPKNAKTDRVIAIEPTMNMFVQKGIGAMIRKRLRTVGVNLNSQTLNQQLAREGSVDGSLSTIDLSMASDTVSIGLVELMLPEEWVRFMKMSRSPGTFYPDGTFHRYQKFSSMGNGFTFELESLIFWALAESATELGGSDRRLAVYGDDIVVPVHAAAVLIEVLSYCGFSCNTDKTFVFGPFRESCGKHYFQGSDVTPIYIRSDVNTLERKFWLANRVKDLAYRMVGCNYGMAFEFRSAWDRIVSSLPLKWQRPRIPRFFGDGGLVGDLDEVHPPRAKHWLEGYSVSHRVSIDVTKATYGTHALVKTLREGKYVNRPQIIRDQWIQSKTGNRAVPWDFPGGVDLTRRKTMLRKRLTVTSVSPRWVGHGPWLAPLQG